MTLASLIQLFGACFGIVGSLFFAIGVIRQSSGAIAKIAGTYWGANPHLLAALTSQKAEYVLGGGLIVAAFMLQLLSFFTTDPSPILGDQSARIAPWLALVGTGLLFVIAQIGSKKLAHRYFAGVQELMKKEDEEKVRNAKK